MASLCGGYFQEFQLAEVRKNIKVGEREVEGKFSLTQSDIKALAKALKEEE